MKYGKVVLYLSKTDQTGGVALTAGSCGTLEMRRTWRAIFAYFFSTEEKVTLLTNAHVYNLEVFQVPLIKTWNFKHQSAIILVTGIP